MAERFTITSKELEDLKKDKVSPELEEKLKIIKKIADKKMKEYQLQELKEY